MAAVPAPAVPVLTGVDAAVAWLRARGVCRLQSDSRRIEPCDAFIAWPGFAADGRRFVAEALARGAVACLVEAEGLSDEPWVGESWATAGMPAGVSAPAPVAALAGLKACTGELVSAFWGHPSRAMSLVAITGTNGKTSTAWWLAQALAAVGRPCGMLGTLGVGMPGTDGQPLAHMRTTGLTTPDPVTVQAQLHHWLHQGVTHCALEASSIGLVEHRLAGTTLTVAVFTNFTQDHLDHHGSMAAYWAAKRSLFSWAGLRAAVVNVDDPQGQRLADELTAEGAVSVWTFSLNPSAPVNPFAPSAQHLCAQSITVTGNGMRLTVAEGVGEGAQCVVLTVPLVGRYNAANVLGVLGSLRALDLTLVDAAQACAHLGAVPGRMEQVNRLLDGDADVALPLVLVDYAHTPDAVHQALAALLPLAQARGGQLHCVVGCGGDRDATKRPFMAAAAEAQAQHLCLTSDNPRSEDPLAILAAMRSGLLRPDAARTVPDRAEAIASQVALALPADVVLIAGKGHETTQEVAGRKLPFSDQAHALQALQARRSGPPFHIDPCIQAPPA